GETCPSSAVPALAIPTGQHLVATFLCAQPLAGPGRGLLTHSPRKRRVLRSPRRLHLYRSQTVTLAHAIASPASEGHVIGIPIVALGTAALVAAFAPASDERQLVHDDDHAASFLAFLRLPPLLEQTPRHADLPSFGEVLRCDLSRLAPTGEVDPVHLVPVAPSWHGDGAGRHRRAVLRVPELRSGSESPDQRNSVHTNASC